MTAHCKECGGEYDNRFESPFCSLVCELLHAERVGKERGRDEERAVERMAKEPKVPVGKDLDLRWKGRRNDDQG